VSIRISIRPLAEVDIDRQALFLGSVRRELGVEFLADIEALLERLKETHLIGTTEGIVLNDKVVYSVPLKKFKRCRLFYQVIGETVDVIRVLHTSQDWTTLIAD